MILALEPSIEIENDLMLVHEENILITQNKNVQFLFKIYYFIFFIITLSVLTSLIFTNSFYQKTVIMNKFIRIFNIRGQIVKTLVDEDKSPGYYSIVWDGTNDSGDEVSSGVYFCQMYTPKNPNGGQFIKAKKMVKIR